MRNWIAVLLLAALPLFCRLGTFPMYPDPWEPQALHVGLQHYLDAQSTFEPSQWRWSAVTDARGTQAAPHAILIEMGLRVVGCSWLGVRLFPTVLAWLSLAVLFFTMRRAYSTRCATMLVLLLATAPLYLMAARTTLNVGVLVSTAILLGCALYWTAQPKSPPWLAALTGLLIAAIPFGYPAGRPLPLFALPILFSSREIYRRGRAYWAVAGLLVGVAPVLPQLPTEFSLYFSGRGESIAGRSFPVALGYFGHNLREVTRELVGYYARWHAGLVDNTSRSEIALYPRVFVPFCLAGFALAAIAWWRERTWKTGWLLVALLAAAIGPLAASVGGVNALRDALLVIPIYAAIALAIDTCVTRFPRAATPLLVFCALVGMDQGLNYFFGNRERERCHFPRAAAPVMLQVLRDRPNAKLRSTACNDDFCNDILRLYGGEAMVEAERSGRLLLDTSKRAPASVPGELRLTFSNDTEHKQILWTQDFVQGHLVLVLQP